jgi:hypothetical protein
VQVTSGPAYDHSPTFLDEDTVAFIRDSCRNGTDIFKKQIGVPGSENITNTPVMYLEALAATFDGTDARIAFTRYNRSSDIFIMDDDGSDVTNLTRTGRIDEYDPDCCSEGCGEEFEERAEISVINANANGRKDLTDGSVAATLRPQGITTYQYGDFVLTNEATGQLYALRVSGVDLGALVGQRVTVSGTLLPGYENDQVEGGPPLLDVTRVDPL